MSLSALIDNSEISRGYGPQTYNYTDTGDIVSASFDYMRTNLNATSAGWLESEEMINRTKRYYELTGGDFVYYDKAYPEQHESQKQEIDAAIIEGRKTDPDKWADVLTSEETREAAREKARLSKQEYDDAIRRASPDAWVKTGSMAGMFAGAMTDPFNILTLPLGLGFGRTVWQVAGVNAAASIASEALQQPGVLEWQKELGQKYGFDEAATSILMAGAMGAGLPLALKGASLGLRGIAEFRGLPPDKARKFDIWAKKQAIDDAIPANKIRDDATMESHYNNVTKTAQTIESEGRLPRLDELDPKSLPSRYTDDGVTFDHVKLVDEARSAGLRPGTKEFDDFIEQKVTEAYRAEAGDTVMAGSDRSMDEMIATGARQQIEQLKAELKQVIDTRPRDLTHAQKLLLDRGRLVKQIDTMTSSMEAAEKSIKSRQAMEALDVGKKPDDLKERINKTKAAASKVDDELLDMYRRPDPMLTVEKPMTAKEFEESLDDLDSPEYQASVEAEFKRRVDDNMVLFKDEDGNDVTFKQIADDIADDERIHQAVMSCAL